MSAPELSGFATSARAIEQRSEGVIRFYLQAHNALTQRTARWFWLSVALTPLLIALYCLNQGYWPVLPFAGMELALLWWVLRRSMRRGERRELIELTPDHVTIFPQPGVSEANTCFPRHWTRVKLFAPTSGSHPSRLLFESRGKTYEVGSFLTDDERRALASRLQQLVGNMNESPALVP